MIIHDLTLPLEPGMRGVQIEPAKLLERDGWNASTCTLYSHCGTHMDAPRHFLPQGGDIAGVDLSVCVGRARVIDLTPVEPRERLTLARLGAVSERIEAGSRVLLRSDWHRRHGTPEYRDSLPRIDLELARWLAERRVALVGVEPPSVADVNNREELTAVHRVLLEAGIVIVEGLAHLDRIAAEEVEFIVLPLRIPGGDGSPVRAIAIEERG